MKKHNFFNTIILSLLCISLFNFSLTSCGNRNPDITSNSIVLPLDTAHSKPGDGIYYSVKTRAKKIITTWTTYTAQTVDHLLGFSYSKDPVLSNYGGYKINQQAATGYFRVAKIGSRWWFIDPDGYPFISKGIAVFNDGSSPLQKQYMTYVYGSSANWVKNQSDMLRVNGFNSTGAWSDVDLIRTSPKPMVYTVIVSPMGEYRKQHMATFTGGVYPNGTYDWHGYYRDVAMVFDPGFDRQVLNSLSTISKYATDKNLLGYFIDNEIAWDDYALDNSIKYLATTEPGYIEAKTWLDNRKGMNATLADITAADRLAFSGFYFETYVRKVKNALRTYDPNHLFLGCRFNGDELQNSEIFRVAGQYMDVISINHYQQWQPVAATVANWANWSGKPFLVSEFYTKADDSGLANNTGAGWIVPTALDRGYFYQNFTIELLRSKSCVGWHWFAYQDNDPTNLNADPSNIDSNKGIVDSQFKLYTPLMDNMKKLNDHVFQLTQFFDK